MKHILHGWQTLGAVMLSQSCAGWGGGGVAWVGVPEMNGVSPTEWPWRLLHPFVEVVEQLISLGVIDRFLHLALVVLVSKRLVLLRELLHALEQVGR